TGAAELCGVALRYRLLAEAQTEPNLSSSADLVAIDTDTRSCAPKEAAFHVEDVMRQLVKTPIRWIYKKIDSVLRGPLLAEVQAILKNLDLPRALLVPANPGLGRIIRQGHYFIKGKPIHETDFGKDPQSPIRSSKVLKILPSTKSLPLYVLQSGDPLPARGIVIGEAACEADLNAWVKRLDNQTLPGGAAEFFSNLLETKLGLSRGKTTPPECAEHLSDPLALDPERCRHSSTLFVCGSASSYSRSVTREFEQKGIPLLRMPAGLLNINVEAKKLIKTWADDTLAALETHPRVLVTIDRPFSQDPNLPPVLTSRLVQLIEQVLSRRSVDHICVEGGGTASALVRHSEWKRLRVIRELAPGVVSMEVQEKAPLLLTVKPGSYRWPGSVMG
ncbi:four-carbon acid sugar kinase family protein, partial [Acidobacteria bacterium AH-259-G07]|nr:four-carbon acid sugar kinase family protein [Acidobacteria bacterium AH-259-G07]